MASVTGLTLNDGRLLSVTRTANDDLYSWSAICNARTVFLLLVDSHLIPHPHNSVNREAIDSELNGNREQHLVMMSIAVLQADTHHMAQLNGHPDMHDSISDTLFHSRLRPSCQQLNISDLSESCGFVIG
jgi:hypothetical protein